MKTDKLIAVALASMTICAGVYAQSSKSGNETSVESEYMSSMEDIVIMEMANSDQRDNKLVALQYLEEAADNGNISPDMMAALNQLQEKVFLLSQGQKVAFQITILTFVQKHVIFLEKSEQKKLLTSLLL